MNVIQRNNLFLQGIWSRPGLFPQLEQMSALPVQFDADFGLLELPNEPGLILIRGARQIGKSTWMELQIRKTIEKFGPGSAVYVSGDELLDADMLVKVIENYLPLFSKNVVCPRIFIDEITAVPKWENALKRLYDAGETRKILIVTTGSKAIDLRRGTERLPGRKGRLERSNYLFTPVSFTQFKVKCEKYFTKDLLITYMLSGGSPIAINELIMHGRIPEYVAELTRDWVLGECAAQGRSRNLLNWIIQALIARGGTTVSLEKLAKESGVANNTVVRGYVELLADLMCISNAYAVDASSGLPLARKAQKYHWINLLAAFSFYPTRPRTIADFKNLSPEEQGMFLEWLVAQELWRRSAICGVDMPELQYFWQSNTHELDFRVDENQWLEVKRGSTSPAEFYWFVKIFPKKHLTVISSSAFKNDFSSGLTFEEFLSSVPSILKASEGH
jgi:predicted AAA+ superfamily ATPase